MKDAIKTIVGKRIKGIVVKESNRPPRTQVFLLFSDDSYYEFHSEWNISGAGGIDTGGLENI